MSNESFLKTLHEKTAGLVEEGLYKKERIITSPQASQIQLDDGSKVINFCANNYLGLAHHPEVESAAIEGVEKYGFGVASVRFICGTQELHKELEARLSTFLQTEDTILYSSCFDANGGCFETLLGPDDAVISDELNHASIIDGIRLCKAKRFRYKNNNMEDLEAKLKEADAQNAKVKLIATDGVFSMDGVIANLKGICDLADRYNALVFVDDCHATGFMGKRGKGSIEYCDVLGRVDILTGTFGKALGGASGGYLSGKKEIVAWLRQRSRPYLFSNALAPCITAASLKVLDLLEQGDELREKLIENSKYFRDEITALGFELVPGEHPIIPVMLGDAKLASEFADALLKQGIYVIGFSFPVVPKGKARIRTQMSAAHSKEDLDKAIEAFKKVGQDLGVISKVKI
ncbi:MAG: 2-amino-3-ketobutyrate coenzyme A ligase [Chlamydiae bacterium]|nr:2-amino-3-ketobutyrate coenzyme A ligase [Chlamydiota bacterium]